MYRSTILAREHYAAKWIIPEKDQRNSFKVINDLGYDYATSPDSPEKEAKLLRVLESFHGYLSKYLCMIVRGTVPTLESFAGRDSKELLRMLAPRNAKFGREQIDATCKMLHLAFKGKTTEDIYDTLAFCFMKAARKYDPHYAKKTEEVCKAIDATKQFTNEELEARVGFDCLRILRSLVRKGFLASVVGKKRKVVGYKVGANWPPPAEFYESGPIGFV